MEPELPRLLEEEHLDIESFLRRHRGGDWGIVDASISRANDRALRTGGPLISVYPLSRGRRLIFIHTDEARYLTAICSYDKDREEYRSQPSCAPHKNALSETAVDARTRAPRETKRTKPAGRSPYPAADPPERGSARDANRSAKPQRPLSARNR
jgi:hypothetical protein